MKKILLFPFAAALFLFACKKDDTVNSSTRLAYIQQGVNPATDTVWGVGYNSAGQLAYIYDVDDTDTSFATYDAAGRITALGSYIPGAGQTLINYDAQGLLQRIEASGLQRMEFTYQNGAIARQDFYTYSFSTGTWQLYESFVYTVANGNVTQARQYNYNGVLVNTINYTYATRPNPFKVLTFFNLFNQMGLSEVANFHTWFSKDALAAFVMDNAHGTITYNYDGAQRLTKTTAAINGIYVPDDVLFTWQFSYE